MDAQPLLVDDCQGPVTSLGTRWTLVADTVMGGVSRGEVRHEVVAGRPAVRLVGDVSLESNGGFVQIALDLSPDGRAIDARAFTAVAIDVVGNSEAYNVHLRTADVVRPWQSYRHAFVAPPDWRTLRLAFSGFHAHRIDQPLDLSRLRRIGVVAIGRAFHADVAVGAVRLIA